MSRVPDRVRQLVVEWPGDAPRGAVEEFCRRHGVSRAWFYKVRARVTAEGAEAAMVKASTRPVSSPRRVPDSVTAAVVAYRRRLSAEGKDCGARSIRDAMRRAGFEPLVSVSTIFRILDRHHMVDRNHRKRPKQSHRRFAAAYANERWQADGVELRLADGLAVVVIEIIDDCTRFNLGLHPGPAETSEVVVEAFRLAIERYGRPVTVHTDNGSAFNRDRYQVTTRLKTFLNNLGIKTLTGRPGHPKSQGKVERSHKTLLNYIDAHQPTTLDELVAVLDRYRTWYNYDRSHQSLPPDTAPGEAYQCWPKISPPGDPLTPANHTPPTGTNRRWRDDGITATRTLTRDGRLKIRGYYLSLGRAWEGHQIRLIVNLDTVELFDHTGTHILTTPWPPTRRSTGLAGQITHHKPPTTPVN